MQEAAELAFREMTVNLKTTVAQKSRLIWFKMLASDGSEAPQRSAGAEQVVALALIDEFNRGKSGPVRYTPLGA